MSTRPILLALLVVQCNHPSGDAAPAASSSASSPSSAAVASSAPAQVASAVTPPSPQLPEYQCDNVITAAFRQKHGFANMKLNQGSKRGSINCHYVDEKAPMKQRGFTFECGRQPSDDSIGIKRQTFATMAKDTVDVKVGRAGFAGTAMGVPQIEVWDDKSPCQLTITFGMETPPPDDFKHPEAIAQEALDIVRSASRM